MADDETKNSDPPESGPDSGDEEEVHTAVETVDAKRKASSEPPPNEDETDETEDHETEDDDESEDDDEDDESKDSQTDDEEAEGGATAPKAAAEPKAHPTGAELEARGHHDFAHVTPVPLLLGVLGCLLVLTFATTAVTSIDMGGQWNLVVAMVIATAKASLVVTFFMHLAWDKKFNLVVFLTSVLFLILFLSMALTDRKEYQHFIDQKTEATQATTAQ